MDNTNPVEQMQRLRAEIANTVQRAETRIQRAYQDGLKDGLGAAIAVFDEFYRAARAAADTPRTLQSVREGLRAGIQHAKGELERRGVEVLIPPLGTPFDPHLMEAISFAPTGSPTKCVSDVYAPGFRAESQLIRPVKVLVA